VALSQEACVLRPPTESAGPHVALLGANSVRELPMLAI
jgi:hypothetical protein